jgi:hypothetical protein
MDRPRGQAPSYDPSLWLLASEGREAVGLYERVGMRTVRAWGVYEKRVV